ncbi:hypothetical protein SS05631_b50770 (plasmid) [Sinorhizobium sp. CCBAU 05631]|nr:hypothetical protein SS05631_b50770 [Sinorhizobium sp. CCBAU 05631]
MLEVPGIDKVLDERGEEPCQRHLHRRDAIPLLQQLLIRLSAESIGVLAK